MLFAKQILPSEAIQIASPPAAAGSVEVRPVRPIREAPNAHQKQVLGSASAAHGEA
jgi:hypothetical protein